jgi:alpha-beta hydrolase superfamily lysophospholipase
MTAGRKKWLKCVLWTVGICFVMMNVVACFHAYKFTHFVEATVQKTGNPEKLSLTEKLKALVFGVNNPRPENKVKPAKPFGQVTLQSNKRVEGWYVPVDSAKGTVVICHGFSGHKGSMLDKSEVFNAMGYNTFLIDFMGSGGSDGNQTTIGYFEAQEVCSAFLYVKKKTTQPVMLFGTSMGAAAIMKAVKDSSLSADALILECPFGSMLETVEARFHHMNVPSFPMANLLVFWGGFQNNFNAFSHNPETYAGSIKVPTLLLYGEKDISVSRGETDRIFANLSGVKELKLYKHAGHENYLKKYKQEWTSDVSGFLAKHVHSSSKPYNKPVYLSF